MFGNFQKSCLRIELEASAKIIGESLLRPENFRQWLFPQQFEEKLPDQLASGMTFTAKTGLITVEHHVDMVSSECVRLLLHQGIDGYHEWYWGEGWVQSRLEGISLLPLSLGQTFALLRLREFVENQED
ncbi:MULTISPECIES: hypothetical protein [Spirulina sp. CCY15215]|uniref:hypothetical protein n=1 Tax=Spirulina sp. CCY15215 TaxID=2767591 RepID=UPI00195072A9|nr:hypothetical protein [Spirulina major]